MADTGATAKPAVGDAVEVQAKEDSGKEKTVKKQSERVLPEMIETAVTKGVRVVLTKTGYEIEGFYKSGSVTLEPDITGGMTATDKKDGKSIVKSFDDIVRLNYDWWKKSRGKSAEFVNPGKEWIDEFVRLGLVKRQVLFIPGDD